MCHEGTIVRKDCTPDSGTRCVPCQSGTFMNQPNGLNKCFLCTACDAAHGLFPWRKCSATADTVCGVLSGYFCRSWANDTGCSLAEKHARCAPGQRTKEPGTNTTDTLCEVCQTGSFSLEGINCTAWTICPETHVKVREGNTSSDVVCAAASRNYYTYISVLLWSFTVAGFIISGRLQSNKTEVPHVN
ncbi:tumor necrosis factor receptor superfamily member 14-like isoform X2 [Mastacembelus armatus]|nr:tumor necrosis factor receptor superfamily member 14-like isoform X2 [Mastacembelus armatus]XP_026189476.1 tumor necrosis factor receptor superfamily member 14-like isoform X2 [Mastacembelus armatus]